jgi:uncharacterized protein (DUF58 family)
MSPVARLTPASVAAPAQHAGRWGVAPARRVFIALLVGLVWIGPAWLDWRFLYASVAWDVLVVLAWYVDLKRLPPPECLETSRAWVAPLAQGDSASVRVSILNKSQVILEVSLQDELPASCLPPPASFTLPRPPALPQLVLTARPGQAVGAEYRVRPSERGDHRVGRVYLRYRTAWQLAERWAFADLCQTVRVYLSLQRSKRQALYLARRRQVEMEKRLERRRGLGREFESLREYRQGDEMRDVCWTATARRGKLITRTYRSERSQPVMIVLDTGRLMLARVRPVRDSSAHIPDRGAAAFGIGRPALLRHRKPPSESGASEQIGDISFSKLDYAVTAAFSLAQVALEAGDSVGLFAYGRHWESRLPPARGPVHLRALLNQLSVVQGKLVEADHTAAASALRARYRRRCLMVWLTDLAETAATPEVIEAASLLLPRHLVLFVAIAQPDLAQLAARRPASVPEMYRYVAAQELVHRRELLLRRLRQQGALVFELRPEDLPSALVNQYLEVKERRLL